LQRHCKIVGVYVLEIQGAFGLGNRSQVNLNGAIKQQDVRSSGNGDAVANAAGPADQLRAGARQFNGNGVAVDTH
jgi:hypothetical protein